MLQDFDDLARGGGGEGRTARVGQILRNVEQGLLLVVEMAFDYSGAGVAQSQALLSELEAAGHRQRGGGEDRGVDRVE